ncbi:hypothetical protein LINGRAHAP2_LOCUS2899, partial [Linum grandiflorum]
DNKQEDESDEELQSEGLSKSDGRDGDPAGHEGMEHSFKGEGGADGGGDLGGYVGWDVDPREVAEEGEGQCEGRVQVGTGDVARGEYYDHHR